MDEAFVCRVCLAADDLEMIFKKENKDLLSKLQLVGGVSIVEDDLPQCICQACSCELQLAYDLISQYEATCHKLRTASQYHKRIKEKPPIAYFRERKKNEAKMEQVQKEMQEAEADSTLVAEIVVKEEMFSNDVDGVACLESKNLFGSSKDFYVYKIEIADDSNEETEEKMSELNLNEGKFEQKTDVENCQAQNDYEEESKSLSDDELSMGSEITVIEVIEDTDTEESFEQNNRPHTVKPEYEREACEAVILGDSKRDAKENGRNECGVSNERFHDDFRSQQMTLCNHSTGTDAPECLKCEKYIKSSKQEAITKDPETTATSLSRRKLAESLKSFVHLKKLRLEKKMQENIVQTNDFDSDENAVLSKYGKRGERLVEETLLRQPDVLESNSKLQTQDKWNKSLANDRLSGNHLQSDAFKCKQCGKRFSSKKNLVQHSNPELLTCEKCGKSFPYLYLLREHHTWHLNPDAFKCKQCGKTYSNKHSLRQHAIIHSNPECLTCDECGKTFYFMSRLRDHKTWHLNPDAFECKKCGKQFLYKHSLVSHTIVHSSPELLTCDKCGKSFAREDSLNEHRMLHLDPNAFKCKQCGKTYSNKHSLRQHAIIHSNPELLTCDKCEKTFSYLFMLRDHKKWHLDPDAFKCEYCDKRFLSKSRLMNHQIIHEKPDAFKCTQCDKQFSSKRSLAIHANIHSNPDLFTCDKCEKTFSKVSLLKDHKKWHLDPDAFKCEHCDKRFLFETDLTNHQVKHKKPDAFKCEQCDKMFSSKQALRKHKITHSNH